MLEVKNMAGINKAAKIRKIRLNGRYSKAKLAMIAPNT
jgi:hypothetical protein